jgi:membrane protease YdiL (CAAX protease family)
MAVSATLLRPLRTAQGSFAFSGLIFAAALGGAEAVYRLAGQFWGAACFAVIFLATVHLAALSGTRGAGTREAAADPALTALIATASLVPLERLLVLSMPTLTFLRLYPNALWVLPIGLTGAQAYRARWIPGMRPSLLPLPGHGRPRAVQAAVLVTGAGLGVLGAVIVPYAGPHVLIHQDAAKWAGAALFALAGGAEELAWRGALQPVAVNAVGPAGIAASYLASAYVAVAWMGPIAAVPVIILTAVTSVIVYRTRYLGGAVAAHFLLNLLLLMLR